MKNLGVLTALACCIVVISLITTKSVFAAARGGIHSSGINHGHNYKRGYYGKKHRRGYKRRHLELPP